MRYNVKINYYDSEGNYFFNPETNYENCKHRAVDTGLLKSWCAKCNIDMLFNRETFTYEVVGEKYSKRLQKSSEE
jgi:hypothetical protein